MFACSNYNRNRGAGQGAFVKKNKLTDETIFPSENGGVGDSANKYKILVIGQVENENTIRREIFKQTVQPSDVTFWVDTEPAQGLNERRDRIAQNHSNLWYMVHQSNADLVWQVENDCVFTENTLEKLLADYEKLKSPTFGYVSGIQVGRHGVYALGAWHFPTNRESFWSVDYMNTGLVECDATGFYCLLAERETWLKGMSSWNGEAWGPDVNFALSLRDQGYKIYVDMDIKVGHKVRRGIIHPDDPSTCNVSFYINDNGEWKYKIS